ITEEQHDFRVHASLKRPGARRAPLKALYTRAPKNKTHQSKKGRRAWTGAATVPKTNNGLVAAPPHRAGGEACARLARHVAALHRVASDLHVALRGFPPLRGIAELPAPVAAEALVARRGRRFHEIVIGVLFGDLVDHARTFVEELLLAGIPLHALEDVLDSVHGRVVMRGCGLGRGTRRRQRQRKRDTMGRLHVSSFIPPSGLGDPDASTQDGGGSAAAEYERPRGIICPEARRARDQRSRVSRPSRRGH